MHCALVVGTSHQMLDRWRRIDRIVDPLRIEGIRLRAGSTVVGRAHCRRALGANAGLTPRHAVALGPARPMRAPSVRCRPGTKVVRVRAVGDG